MYCDEWDLLFILGGRKLPVFEIVRHDFRRLAEKNETHQDERIASFNFVDIFPDKKTPYLLPCINLTLGTIILFEIVFLKFLQVSTSSVPQHPFSPLPVWADLSLASEVTCCSCHSWGSSSFNKSLSNPPEVPSSALGCGGTMVNVAQSLLPQRKRSVKYSGDGILL